MFNFMCGKAFTTHGRKSDDSSKSNQRSPSQINICKSLLRAATAKQENKLVPVFVSNGNT